jgi:hypothetical protein
VAVSIILPVGSITDRARLISRIEVEARAYRNADATTRNLRYGRVLGLLEAGTILGYWPRKVATRIADAVYYGATPRMLRLMLKRLRHAAVPWVLRAGLSALGAAWGANAGRDSPSPFVRLARPPGLGSPGLDLVLRACPLSLSRSVPALPAPIVACASRATRSRRGRPGRGSGCAGGRLGSWVERLEDISERAVVHEGTARVESANCRAVSLARSRLPE